MTLHDFLAVNWDELVARTRSKVAQRPWPEVSTCELGDGIPFFLTQLAETLRLESTEAPFPASAIGSSATKHGGQLLAMGFTVSQVVHDYGDVCQAITELAVEKAATISVEEFRTLNRCLDTAIAEAVTEYGRLQQASARDEVEQRGQVAHELRNQIHTAMLAFHVLKAGKVAIGGSTGTVLGHSLAGLRELIDTSLSEMRLQSGIERRDRVSLPSFVGELVAAANLHAEYHGIRLNAEHVDPALAVTTDPQLLASAVMNLLQNAFKFTHAHGVVTLRARAKDARVLIDVEDECGGLAAGKTELSQSFGDRRKQHRSGLGLGLAISRKAVKASGGEINSRNIPGKGCVFTIDLPLAA